ncbi:MAG: DbpA RNA binding domain-containing protein [Nitrospiraceae bacterium]
MAAAALKWSIAPSGVNGLKRFPTVPSTQTRAHAADGPAWSTNPGRGRLAENWSGRHGAVCVEPIARPGSRNPGDLVGAITSLKPVSPRSIGAIKWKNSFSIVDVAEDAAGQVIEALGRARLKGQRWR